MSANGNRPWLRLTMPGLVLGILIGSLPGAVAGIIWQNFRIAALEKRFDLAVLRFDELKRNFIDEITRDRDEHQILERGIADNRRDLALVQGALPLKLPTINQLIEQDAHIHAQDGRIDDVFRKLAAMCGQLAGISAASAKKSGC